MVLFFSQVSGQRLVYKFVNLPFDHRKKSKQIKDIKEESRNESRSPPEATRTQDENVTPRHRIERRPSVIKMSGKVSPPREPSPVPEEDTHEMPAIKEEHVDVERVSPQIATSYATVPDRFVSAPSMVVPMNTVTQNGIAHKLYNYQQFPYMAHYARGIPLDLYRYHPYTVMQSPCCGRVNIAAIRPRSVIIRPSEHYPVTNRSPPPLIKAEPVDVTQEAS